MAAIGVPFLRRPKRTLRDALSQVEDPRLLEVPEALAYGPGVRGVPPDETLAPRSLLGDPRAPGGTPTYTGEPVDLGGGIDEEDFPLPATNPALDRIRQEYEEAQNPPDRGFV